VRTLKKGDRVKVIDESLRHFGHVGIVQTAHKNWAWVLFADGKDAPFSRWELRALPRRKKKQ
jgi:hypothetical protein